MAAFHRLDIAAELFVKFIDKRHRPRAVKWRVRVEPAGDPFVPSRDKDERWVHGERVVPLLREVAPCEIASLGTRLPAIMKTASARFWIAQHAKLALHRILTNADRRFFCCAVTVGEDMLRRDLQPAPFIWPPRTHEIIRLRFAKCKELQT